MSEQSFTVNAGLVVKNGLTVEGGTIDFSGASSGGGIELTDLSVTNASAGSSALAYDSATGAFTFTPPDLSTYATTSNLSSYATTASLSNYALTSSLAAVATSGAYADITGTPSLATVATSGAYADITGTPSLATVATSGLYSDITGTPTLATVATSGAYSDLTGTPSVPTTTDNLTEGSSNLYFTNARASSAITGSDLDMGGNKVLFANMYSAEGNLPSATTYHGMFAHVHGTGKGYFAHNGNWVKLLDETSSTTTNLTEGTNLYYTNARVDSRLSSGNVATITTSGDITVGGDLTVSGTTTTVNTETINLADNTITLNSNYTGSSPTEDGGIEIERGTLTNKTLVWDETNDKWTVGSETFVAGTFEGNLTGNVTGTVSSLSNHDTDDVSEGASNLYYTDARARAAVSATNATAGTAALSYNSSTGQFTFTPPDLSSYLTSASLSGYATTASLAAVATSGAYSDLTGTPTALTDTDGLAEGSTNLYHTTARARSSVSATTGAVPSGGGALGYNQVNGQFTFTPADLSTYLTDITGESLSDLSDVASTTPTDGQVLTYDTTNGWQPETPSSGGIALTDLSVSTNTASGGGALSYDNTTGVFSFTPASTSGGGSVNWIASANTSAAGTPGNGGIALGGNTSVGSDAVAVGNYAVASASESVAVGSSQSSTAHLKTNVTGSYGVAIGSRAQVHGNGGISMGWQAEAGTSTKAWSIAIGNQALSQYEKSVAIGYSAATTADSQLMLGGTTTNGFTSVQVGNTSYTPTNSMDLTTKSYVDSAISSAGGVPGAAESTTTTAPTATGTSGLAVGYDADAGGNYGTAVGFGANAGASSSVALGYLANTATGTHTIAIGASADAQGTYGIALGLNSEANYNYSAAIGYFATAGQANQLMLGRNSTTNGFTSIRVGNTSYTPSDNMDLATKAYVDANAGGWDESDYVEFGSSMSVAAYTTSQHAIAIGDNSWAKANETIAIGSGTRADGINSICIGNSAESTNYAGQVCIGAFADTKREYSTAIGYYAETGNYTNGATAIGGFTQALGSSTVAVGSGYNTTYHTQAYSGGQAFGAFAYSQLGGTALGYNASQAGSYAHAFGGYANASGTQATAVGYFANANSSYQFVLGNSSVSDLRCQDTSISAVSDRRDKINIEALEVGLDFVNAIQPVAFYKNNRNTYYVPSHTVEEIAEDPSIEVTWTFDQEAYEAGTEKHERREFGFIAQEVAEQLPEQYNDARVSFNETHHLHGFDVQHFTMGDMTPILWKALRELSDKHDQLQSDYDALLARVVALENA